MSSAPTVALISLFGIFSTLTSHYGLSAHLGKYIPVPLDVSNYLREHSGRYSPNDILFSMCLLSLAISMGLYLRRRSRFPPLVPYSNPLEGSTKEYAANPKKFINEAFQKYGPVFRANILGREQAVLDHSYAKLLFNLLGKGFDHEQGVIDLQYFDVIIKLGSQHHLHDSGRIILKYLNPSVPSYDTYGPIVQMVYMRKLREALSSEKGAIDIANPFELCGKCLADAMASVMVGENLANDKDIAWVFLNVSRVVAEVGGLGGHGSLLSLLFPFYGRLHAHYVMKVKQVMKPYKTVLRAKLKIEINRRINLRQKFTDSEWKENRPHDVLQGLLEEHNFGNGHLKVDDFMLKIENILLFVIFAAVHGTSVALSWVLYLVAKDPTYQQKLYTELAEYVDATDDASALTPSVLKNMVHLDSFTREALRWRPDCLSPTPRMAMKDIELPNGSIIPKGMLVTHVFYRTHTNSEKQGFDDVEDFKPWRWVGKQAAQSTNVSNSFLPFGVGKTACPGRFLATYEIKLFIALIVGRYKVSLPNGMTVDQPGFTFQSPPSGIMHFEERSAKDILV